jgi:uridine monophosphate synthetase
VTKIHPLTLQLRQWMREKKSNLAVALDLSSQKELLRMADLLGPEICVLKTHVDILEDYTPDFGDALTQLAERHRFLIFEDRKFADIGQTVALQYGKGIYRIAEWAHIINAHIIPGPGIIEGLKKIGAPLGRGLLLLAEMSSSGTVAQGAFTQQAVEMGEAHDDFVMGFISLHKVSQHPGMLHFTPGVKLKPGVDALGQRYRSMQEILSKNRSDIIIIGREITQAADPCAMAKIIRKLGWSLGQSDS